MQNFMRHSMAATASMRPPKARSPALCLKLGIVDGKLYLNFSLGAQDITGNIALADGFWPSLHS